MKKWIVLWMCMMLLVACTSNETDVSEATFTGLVEAIEDQTALVSVSEGAILSSGNRVNVYIGYTGKDQLVVGEKISVTYDGSVMESDPLQVNEIKILKADGSELIISQQAVESFTFKARIKEVTEDGYILLVDEDQEVRNSSDLISIATQAVFEVDDHVLVEYDGAIMESYPAQINMLSIEKID